MSQQPTSSHASEVTPHQGGLLSASFIGLLMAQFLGTWNDNVFRYFIVFLGATQIEKDLAISVGTAAFTLPYLFFATVAGWLADRFSKQKVIIYLKSLEIVFMTLGLVGIWFQNIYFLFAVVALTGCQCALFGPAKFGALPEILRPEKLSIANGLMGLVTVVGTAMGVVMGAILFERSGASLTSPINFEQIHEVATFLLGLGVVGFIFTLIIKHLPAADPARKLKANPVGETIYNLRTLYGNRALFSTALGMAFFWFMANLAQSTVLSFGDKTLFLTESEVAPLQAMLVLGVAAGSLLAGLWSAGKIELGIVTIGGFGMSISATALFFVGTWLGPAVAKTQAVKMQSVSASAAEVVEGTDLPATLGTDATEENADRPTDNLIQKCATPDRASHTPEGRRAILWTCIFLLALGLSAGLFNVPLEAYLQHRSDPKQVGVNIAASNFMVFSFILLSSGLYWVLRQKLGLSPSSVFLVAGVGAMPVAIWIFKLIPKETIRCLFWLVFRVVYKVRVYGSHNLPVTGGGLIVCNHVSWLDGILLILNSERPIRMIAWADYISTGVSGWLARLYGTIPIKPEDGPRAIVTALNTAKEAVKNGELVCIFAEGQLTRTGQLQPFQRGLMKIIDKTDAPVIPTYLDELWGSIFSHRDGKFFWKLPRRWPYPITLVFGEPIKNPDNVNEVRLAVEKLGVDAAFKRMSQELIPARVFMRKCRTARFQKMIADSTGQEMVGSKVLIATLCIKRALERHWLKSDEKNIGILLPPSNGGLLANTALTVSGRVAVNLNYTLSDKDVRYCIEQAGIRHVITSRKFLEKKPIDFNAEVIFMEDLKEQVSGFDKACSAIAAHAVPMCLLERWLGLTSIKPTDLMTIIFTSGSTGEPKGVMLSHHNISSNISSADQLFQITSNDVVLGVLPFFHSFGYTLMMWLPLNVDAAGVYHYNPLDARTIGELSQKHKVTIVAATPTFLKTYLKRCEKEQFATLDLAIVGAEKLPESLAAEFLEKFGITPTEGYGCTELSPLAAANVPDHRAKDIVQIGTKLGTVGRAVPNVCAKIVDPDTLVELGNNKPGLLIIGGPNVMQGYLNQPEKTAGVIHDGWYNTGDIAEIDDEGFIKITGRLSRFSKIGGEMVPHIRIEEELNKIIDIPGSDDTDIKLVVSSVPDAKKGERLVVIHTKLSKPVDEILKELGSRDLPNLWIPSADSFREVDSIPLLGTGKLDLRAVKQQALDAFGPSA